VRVLVHGLRLATADERIGASGARDTESLERAHAEQDHVSGLREDDLVGGLVAVRRDAADGT
jgi:hypothetical protein